MIEPGRDAEKRARQTRKDRLGGIRKEKFSYSDISDIFPMTNYNSIDRSLSHDPFITVATCANFTFLHCIYAADSTNYDRFNP